MQSRSSYRSFGSIACLAFASMFAFGQISVPPSPAAECSIHPGSAQVVHGTVTDDSGALLPGTSIILECAQFRKTTQTDSSGNYTVSAPPGTYHLTIEASGFAVNRHLVAVSQQQEQAQFDVKLSVEASASTITVTANPDYVADNSDTATKTTTALIDTAQSVSVVTSMQMEARDVQTVDQAISYTAGVNPEPYGNDPRVDWFFIRGFAENDDAVYLDGLGTSKIYAFESQFMVSPYSLQSVDVMKGPTSVLYGANQPGGLVNLVSKQPLATAHNEIRFEGGTFNRYQGSIDSTGPLLPKDLLSYRLTSQVRSSGSQVQFAMDDLVYAEPALLWKPDTKTAVTVTGNFTEARQGSIAQFLPAVGTLLPNPNGQISTHFFDSDPSFDKYQKKLYFAGYSLRRAVGERWSFRQNFRSSHMSTLYKALYGIGIEADNRTLDRASILGNINVSHDALDNQLQGNLRTGGIQHTLLAGVGYAHQNDLTQLGYLGYDFPQEVPSIDLYSPVYGVTITPPPYNGNNATETVKQFGIYLQDQLQWNKWIVMLGGREDWSPQHLNDTLNVDIVTKNDSKFTGRTGLLYHSSFGLAPYFSYSTFFNPTAGVNSTGKPYRPTTGDQYEVGAKYQPAGLNAFITASLFDLTQNNTLTTDPNNVQLQIQTGQLRSRGLELESTASLLFNLNLVASYTHDQVVYTRDNSGFQGKRPVYTPANLASVWLDYTPKYFGVGAGSRFIGITWADPGNTIQVPGHTVMDAEAHYVNHGVRYAFSAANLLDNTYVAYCYQTIACNYGPRRSMTGTITVELNSLLHPLKQQ